MVKLFCEQVMSSGAASRQTVFSKLLCSMLQDKKEGEVLWRSPNVSIFDTVGG